MLPELAALAGGLLREREREPAEQRAAGEADGEADDRGHDPRTFAG